MKEVEADHIGLLLLAAAGYDPRVAPGLYLKLGKLNGDDFSLLLLPREGYHPPCKERARFLSQPDVMNKALDLYRGVHAAQGTTEY
jgi:metalloendopeptidase OMA1, mitochondrial